MMASQTQGIQQLLTAEKRAADKVSEARKRKARRIKQARDEAQAEIERYRQERERLFKEYEAKYMGSKEDVAAKIDKNAQILIQDLHLEVENNKERVLTELLDIVCNIKPEVHRNYFVMNPRK
ncbi:vacuolar atp synthase subunit g [Holotrichia oblita]|uniref:Vacuolar atp synthase subunit g n=1 Tax=Holotrichia oblita TaxID=644536 RepID=A0ACB9TPV4_HOLOL|nr:vacuolar atp synthase subunit g [Holotrichia oblita]